MQDLNRPTLHNETVERPPSEDNTYMGYSVAPGRFSGNPSQGQACSIFSRIRSCFDLGALQSKNINKIRDNLGSGWMGGTRSNS